MSSMNSTAYRSINEEPMMTDQEFKDLRNNMATVQRYLDSLYFFVAEEIEQPNLDAKIEATQTELHLLHELYLIESGRRGTYDD